MFNIWTLNSFKDVEVGVHLNKKVEIKFKIPVGFRGWDEGKYHFNKDLP